MEKLIEFCNFIDFPSFLTGIISCMLFNAIFATIDFIYEKAKNEVEKRKKNKEKEKEE